MSLGGESRFDFRDRSAISYWRRNTLCSFSLERVSLWGTAIHHTDGTEINLVEPNEDRATMLKKKKTPKAKVLTVKAKTRILNHVKPNRDDAPLQQFSLLDA